MNRFEQTVRLAEKHGFTNRFRVKKKQDYPDYHYSALRVHSEEHGLLAIEICTPPKAKHSVRLFFNHRFSDEVKKSILEGWPNSGRCVTKNLYLYLDEPYDFISADNAYKWIAECMKI
ncbi:hypothetical protein IHE26_06725 [Plesiomonas shigelloides]|uniref:hypothetical protein n=1 Tax=Plesiomonas shigelloides TaxID=703 RepID=UPI001781853B|nr:hypothetical protein [Plesiomonas shigelloides]QOH80953.1 hypothetical protein IHE26_06725 [Plesiomonas shigelloides]